MLTYTMTIIVLLNGRTFSLQVCTNGMLTVGTPPLLLGTAQKQFPTSDTRISQSNLLVPFWNDHDGRDPESSVTYRVYGGAAGDPDFMQNVSSFISKYIDAELFEPTWMLVASWRGVPPYPHTATDRGRVSAVCMHEGVLLYDSIGPIIIASARVH